MEADRLKLIDAGEGDRITILIESYTYSHGRGSSDTQEQRKEHEKLFKNSPKFTNFFYGYRDVSELVLRGRTYDHIKSVNANIRIRENALSEENKKELDKADAAYAGDIHLNDISDDDTSPDVFLDVFLNADAGTKQMLMGGLSNNTRCELHLTVGRILDTEKAWIQKFELKLLGKAADYKTRINIDDDELEVDPHDERHWAVLEKLGSSERMLIAQLLLLALVAAFLIFK